MFPLFPHLSKEQIIYIIRAPMENNADLVGSNTFYSFIENVRKSGLFSDEDLDTLLTSSNLKTYLKVKNKADEDDLDLPF